MFDAMKKLSKVVSPALASIFLFSSTVGVAQASTRGISPTYFIDYGHKSVQKTATAAPLFDHDTATRYAPQGAELIERSYAKPVTLKALKIYGAEGYKVSVDYHVNGLWQHCEGWENIASSSNDAWHTYTLTKPITTNRVRIALVPTQENADGVAEIAFVSKEALPAAATHVIADGGIGSDAEHRYTLVDNAHTDDASLKTFTFTTAYHPEQIARAELTYDVEGVSGGASVVRAVNDELAQGGLLVQAANSVYSGKKVRVTEEIDPNWLKAGLNKIKFIVPEGAMPKPYRVSNVSVSIKTGQTPKARLVAFAPQGNLSYKGYAYLRGFVETQGNPVEKITVGGTTVAQNDGAFEALVKVRGDKPVTVEAALKDGTVLTKEVAFSTSLSLLDAKNVQLSQNGVAFLNGKQAPFYTKNVLAVAGHETVVSLADATLDIRKNALEANRQIKVATLGERDLPPLDPGMVNVTKGSEGYRFLPHGTKFDTKNNLKIAYDAQKLPKGMSAKDVKTYFFDEETGRWLPLPKVASASGVVMSTTTHFTDMINAVIKTPDAPQAKAFNATQIKDLKIANPGAKINLIKPPKASSQGDARLSYPIEVPAGRHGMAPSLSVNYSSGGSNSWMGLGWDLAVPSVDIDTRWGVPRYKTDVESETYTIAGQQLSPLANRGTPQPRTSEKRFYPRVEGSFSKIIRHGSNPTDYWWEVTSKDGTKSYYGGTPSDGLIAADVLTDADSGGNGNIGHWALAQTVDVYGNTVTYTYAKVSDSGVGDGKGAVKGKQLYIKNINYTGFESDSGAYDVSFIRDRDLQEPRRLDVSISARLGFKRVTADLLRKIEVKFDGTTFRSYDFGYTTGAFDKTLLSSIKQYDADGALFNTHSFTYYNEVGKNGTYDPYTSKQSWQVDPTAYTGGGDGTITVPTPPTLPNTGNTTPIFSSPITGMTAFQSFAQSFDGISTTTSQLNTLSGVTATSTDILTQDSTQSTVQDPSGDFKTVQATLPGATGYGIDNTSRNGVVDLTYATDSNVSRDFIRAWKAPFDGTINIDAPAALVYVGDNKNADGVRVSIQRENSVLWNTTIAPDDYTVKQPDGVSYIDVKKGDVILFRIQDLSNSVNDIISWSPVISYVGQSQTQVDANELPLYKYCFSKEYLPQPTIVELPYSGVLSIAGDIVKPVVSDDVNLTLVKYSASSGTSTVLWQQGYKASQKVQTSPEYGDIDVQAGDKIYAVVSTQSNVDFNALSWHPVVTYKNVKKRFVDRVILGSTDISTFQKSVLPYCTVHEALKNAKAWVAPADENLSVNPAVSQAWGGTDAVNFTLKSGGQLLAKQTLSPGEAQTAVDKPLSVSVYKGQSLYLSYHDQGTSAGTASSTPTPKVEASAGSVDTAGIGYSELPTIGSVPYRGWGDYLYAASSGDVNSAVDVANLQSTTQDLSSLSTQSQSTAANGTTSKSGSTGGTVTLAAVSANTANKQLYVQSPNAATVLSSGVPTSLGLVSALSGSRSTSSNIRGSVTVGPLGSSTTKDDTFGGDFGSGKSETNGILAFVDIDGDGLPDQVFVSGGALVYKKNLSHAGIESFGTVTTIHGVQGFSHSNSSSSNVGLEANFGGAFAGINRSTTRTTTDNYFSDVNDDGLIDIVKNGVVYYNHLDSKGVPTFSTDSVVTPNPIGASASVESKGWIPAQTTDELAQLAKENPLQDTVKVWKAPENGTVAIDAPVQLVEDKSLARQDYTKADGVRVSIQHNGTELWSQRIGPKDYNTTTPKGLNAIKVKAGEYIYFRVDSVDDGMYDKVNWTPVIRYTDRVDQLDANNLRLYRYDAKKNFILTGGYVSMPIDGTVSVSSTFTKPDTSDDITLRLAAVDKNGNDSKVLWERNITQAAFDKNVSFDDFDVNKDDRIRFEVLSDTNVDWAKIHWKPTLSYVATPDENVTLYDKKGNRLLYVNVVPTLYPYNSCLTHTNFWAPDDNMTQAVITPVLPAQSDIVPDGKAVFSIKRDAKLIGKQSIEYKSGESVTTLKSFTVDLTDKHPIYIEYHSSNEKLATYLADINASAKIVIDGNTSTNNNLFDSNVTTVTRIAGVFTVPKKDKKDIFGPMYRQWGQFIYNPYITGFDQPMDEKLLSMDTTGDTATGNHDAINNADDNSSIHDAFSKDNYDPSTATFGMMVPVSATASWQGADADSEVNQTTITSTRMGLKNIYEDSPLTKGDGSETVRAINKVSKSTAQSYSVSYYAGISYSQQTNKTLTDFIDMNGDGYPDIVGNDRFQYTTMRGGLENNATGGLGVAYPSYGTADTMSFSAGTFPVAKLLESGQSSPDGTNANQSSTDSTYTASSNDPSAGLSAQASSSQDESTYAYRDINGDGLPDRIYKNGDVQLNLGYRFAARENWGFGKIHSGESKGYGAGGSLTDAGGAYPDSKGINILNYSISVGLTVNVSQSEHLSTLIDLNGDGLLDELYITPEGSIYARLNTGGGFTDPMPWSNEELYHSETVNASVNAYFTACVNVPVPPFRFCISPGVSGGQGGSRDKATLKDIDGDGIIDVLTSSGDDNLNVRTSKIGKTNLLESVQRPLGAKITLDYKRVGNTYKNPHSKWVLSKETVFDGHKGDGVDTMEKLFSYKGGYYDRHERTFYGFAQVTTSDINTADANKTYRKKIAHYINTNYYEKGLMDYSKTTDDANRTYVEKFNTYKPVDIFTQKKLSATELAQDDRNVFPQLERTQTLFYEGQSKAGQQTAQAYTYDQYGNVLTMHDYGDVNDPNDDYKAYVTYYEDPDAYILSVPQTIHIYDNRGRMLRHREATVDDKGAVTEVRINGGGVSLTTDMTYDDYGNLHTITYPPNAKGQRYALDYTMDDVVHTYTTTMHDSFGYTATAAYDYRFGVQTLQTDINHQPIVTTVDAKGRMETITGPLEAGTGKTTISQHYYPDAAVPYAVTKHYDEERPDTIDTVTFIDGLKRVIQTKKDAAIDEGKDGVSQDGMIVSGHVDFDSFGRVVATYYPVAEVPASESVFNTDIDGIAPTRTTYDVMNRKVLTTLPDGSTMKNQYGFGSDRNGVERFHTLSTDADGNTAESFKDVRGRITSVLQHNPAADQPDIWTSYSYDAVNQLVGVKDNRNHLTKAVYDMAGRRTSIDNPDTGWVQTFYDNAGNVIKKITPNLRMRGKAIHYVYDYNRLTNINYPFNTQNDVTYTYGDDPSAYNVGRVIEVKDGSGTQLFEYGKLGETTKDTRTLLGATGETPKTYVTSYRYDTWNRLQQLTYPDGEVLTYTYDSGGKLSSMEGRKGSHKYKYLKALTYDKFGQRVFLRYGNDTTTKYTYEPERRRLSHIVAANSQRTFMDDTYTYDHMQNILSITNGAAVPVGSSEFGGETEQHYSYDNLYQLTGANGDWKTRQGHEHRYTLAMSYDTIGNIRIKNQKHERLPYDGDKWIVQKPTTYDWNYTYHGMHPHAATMIGNRMFSYDMNGNQTGWTNMQNHSRRVIKWDEENRISSISDNGQTSYYVYDAKGDRTLKRTSQGETFYVNPYYVIREGEVASKHFFVGSQRIATKLVKLNGNNSGKNSSNSVYEKQQYYYHPDHLGSSSFVTDRNGKVYEHLEYFPSGEEFAHEHSNTQVTPYRFTGKEYDEMTGLYYYGARYYDPRTSVWESPDPILGKYMDGKPNGGVFNPRNLQLFTYVGNNPINLVDFTGKSTEEDPRIFAATGSHALAVDSTGHNYSYKKSDEAFDDIMMFAGFASMAKHIAGDTIKEGVESTLTQASKMKEGFVKNLMNSKIFGANSKLFGNKAASKAQKSGILNNKNSLISIGWSSRAATKAEKEGHWVFRVTLNAFGKRFHLLDLFKLANSKGNDIVKAKQKE